MKAESSFIIGLLSTFGMAEILGVQDPTLLNSFVILFIQCMTSLIAGIISAVIVAWMKNRWRKSDKD